MDEVVLVEHGAGLDHGRHRGDHPRLGHHHRQHGYRRVGQVVRVGPLSRRLRRLGCPRLSRAIYRNLNWPCPPPLLRCLTLMALATTATGIGFECTVIVRWKFFPEICPVVSAV